MSGIIVQSGQYCRQLISRRGFKERCPSFRPGLNTDSTEFNGGLSLHVGARDTPALSRPNFVWSRWRPAGLASSTAPLMGSWTKSPQKSEALTRR
jgi:hypothetical protein